MLFHSKIMKRLTAVCCALTLFCGFASCATPAEKTKLKVVTAIFPQYDWVKEVVGDVNGVSLKLLADSGVDLHSYQPSVSDIAAISGCDLFIYTGGESDEWVENALKNSSNEDRKVINLLETLGDKAKLEETVEGMQHDHDHEEGEEDHDHDHEEGEEDHDHDHEEHEEEYDEHVWLSLKNAAFFVGEISKTLCEIDEENALTYANNASAYQAKLSALDKEYASALTSPAKNTLLFADRFPFRYLVDDYSLHYYAAFSGCSAESEASFETITFLAQKVDELNLSVILTIEGGNGAIAQTVKESTKNKNQQILTLNSLQSVTKKEVKNGASYLSAMQENLKVLKEAVR